MNLVMRIKRRNRQKPPIATQSDGRVARQFAMTIAALLLISPAWAQLSQVNTLLNTIQATLLGVGGVICSISIIWAGFRMMFQHARFGDIANVFIGGLFVGCATVIAGMLIPAG
ncbi:TrbC/VirB2 family protein [Paraburkholderia sacchari]|uniref:TrbC/VirB2 family protein n=1 Tax=Paraburkholderia sacchari TaxID=159450 RepID=UPI001BCE8073|nr:TrbC/VirB2 family protein [Paraburkholderia sacchari]